MTTEREQQVPILDAVEVYHLGWPPREEVRPGFTYYGDGGLIGTVAIALVIDGGLVFKGCSEGKTSISLTTQPYVPSHTMGKDFWPTKLLMPAPKLENIHLVRWLLNQEQAIFRQQIHNLESLPPELKTLPAYLEYLEYFSAALQNTLRKIDLTYPAEERTKV